MSYTLRIEKLDNQPNLLKEYGLMGGIGELNLINKKANGDRLIRATLDNCSASIAQSPKMLKSKSCGQKYDYIDRISIKKRQKIEAFSKKMEKKDPIFRELSDRILEDRAFRQSSQEFFETYKALNARIRETELAGEAKFRSLGKLSAGMNKELDNRGCKKRKPVEDVSAFQDTGLSVNQMVLAEETSQSAHQMEPTEQTADGRTVGTQVSPVAKNVPGESAGYTFQEPVLLPLQQEQPVSVCGDRRMGAAQHAGVQDTTAVECVRGMPKTREEKISQALMELATLPPAAPLVSQSSRVERMMSSVERVGIKFLVAPVQKPGKSRRLQEALKKQKAQKKPKLYRAAIAIGGCYPRELSRWPD